MCVPFKIHVISARGREPKLAQVNSARTFWKTSTFPSANKTWCPPGYIVKLLTGTRNRKEKQQQGNT